MQTVKKHTAGVCLQMRTLKNTRPVSVGKLQDGKNYPQDGCGKKHDDRAMSADGKQIILRIARPLAAGIAVQFVIDGLVLDHLIHFPLADTFRAVAVPKCLRGLPVRVILIRTVGGLPVYIFFLTHKCCCFRMDAKTIIPPATYA